MVAAPGTEVGLYQRKLKEAGISPDEIRTLDDVEKLPLHLQKGTPGRIPVRPLCDPLERDRPDSHHLRHDGQADRRRYTRQDLDNWSELIARNLTMIGLSEDDVFQNAVNYGLFTGGGSGSITAPRRSGGRPCSRARPETPGARSR